LHGKHVHIIDKWKTYEPTFNVQLNNLRKQHFDTLTLHPELIQKISKYKQLKQIIKDQKKTLKTTLRAHIDASIPGEQSDDTSWKDALVASTNLFRVKIGNAFVPNTRKTLLTIAHSPHDIAILLVNTEHDHDKYQLDAIKFLRPDRHFEYDEYEAQIWQLRDQEIKNTYPLPPEIKKTIVDISASKDQLDELGESIETEMMELYNARHKET
jgi:hypothetical protein